MFKIELESDVETRKFNVTFDFEDETRAAIRALSPAHYKLFMEALWEGIENGLKERQE